MKIDNKVTFFYPPSPEDFPHFFSKELCAIPYIESLQLSIIIKKLELKCYGQFIIYGRPELVLFLIVIFTRHGSFCRIIMVRTVFCTVYRE